MTLQSIDVSLSRVMFCEPSRYDPAGGCYTIARTYQGYTVKGRMDDPVTDHPYRLWGEWQLQKPYRGRPPENAFVFEQWEALCDRTTGGIAQYLRNFIDGLGDTLSRRLVDEFDADTLDILRADPDRALAVRGVTEKIVENIKEHFASKARFDPAAYARLVDLFNAAEVKVSRKTVLKLLDFWGSNAPDKVKQRPYDLLALPRMGWTTVDGFALSPVVGYDPRGLERHKQAILEALERIANEGHTHAGRVDIESIAFDLLKHLPAPQAWLALLADKSIEHNEDTDTYSLAELADAERTIAGRLSLLGRHAGPLGFSLLSPELNEDQLRAVELIERHGVCILAGPPGTGKTWTVSHIVRTLIDNGVRRIAFVAPTGKAARRGAELLPPGVPCSTIHKSLKPVPGGTEQSGVPGEHARVGRGRSGFVFAHNESNPLERDFIIADESSMIDCNLMSDLLEAVRPGCRVLFVGDQNQLPSVGPGSVLRDMIAAGIPTAMLSKIVRSDGGGRVVRACHAIKDGRMPEPAPFPPKLPLDNWSHIEEGDPGRIGEIIAELCRPYSSFPDATWDIQVVSAQHGRPGFGCKALNRTLSRKLNPDGNRDKTASQEMVDDGSHNGNDQDDGDAFDPSFIVGDKVIRRKNGLADLMVPIELREDGEPRAGEHVDWTWREQPYLLRETAVVNGDMGIVEDIVIARRSSSVVVRFRNPERLCRLPYGDCHLQRAYAITCHSAQGSGFPMVIVPVHRSHYWDARNNTGLWCRELIYTAISRTEQVLITVGQFESIRESISRKTIDRRRTRLAGLIRGNPLVRSNRVVASDASEGTIKEIRDQNPARPIVPAAEIW